MKKKVRETWRKIKKNLFPANYIFERIDSIKYEVRRSSLIQSLLKSNEPGVLSTPYCDHEIIVSLTSYGKRLYEVGVTIESIMQQTMPPNRIVLNLDKEAESLPIPITLQRLMKRGLEINIIPDHIRSYKKLLPTLQLFPNAIIITVDDDCIYEFDLIERLFNSYLKYPNAVSAVRVHSILLGKDGKPLPYHKWQVANAFAEKGNRLFPTGVGGVLYPPGTFSTEVFNQEVFTRLAPTADDIWFHAMAIMNGTEIVKVPSHSNDNEDHIENVLVQDIGLINQNCELNRANDIQLKAVYDYYDIYPLLSRT
ncbi:MAG: hypothetical protein HDS03_04210 [Bacteroides sp.]|nr:hypothetical protein [Bacteroides sp.]